MSILIVDDEKDIRELIGDILQDEGYKVRLAANSNEAMAEVNASPPHLLILDIWLKDSHMDGIDILKTVKRDNPDVPIVIISGHANIEIAVAAIKKGAYDFIEKPFNIDQLLVVVRRAMEASRLRRENADLRRRDIGDGAMIGSSAAFRNLKVQLEKVARTSSRIMLSGPSGCGKELAARFIRASSSRADSPFITVSSATIAPDHMEEVLFGRETPDRGVEKGLLEQAHGGIVYFDEVADMPLGTQSKLLRVLVDQQFSRVGGTGKVRVDLRVISSTTRDLRVEVAAGRFRQELYDRLNVVSIDVPGLDARREDTPELAHYFIEQLHRTQGLPLRGIAQEAEVMLQTLSWPGNVRQLRNMIERILILCDENGPITPDEIMSSSGAQEKNDSPALSGAIVTMPLREAREVFEREYLLIQINRFSGNISRTAHFVEMERSALHRKLKSLGVVTSARHGQVKEDDSNNKGDDGE